MEIKGYTLIQATKDNDEVMGKFYTEVLGFTKNEMGGYTLGGLNVFFDRHSKAAVKALESFRCMPTLEVADIQETFKDLKDKGVNFVRTPSQEEWGGWFATLVDPDGNYLQIFQKPKDHQSYGKIMSRLFPILAGTVFEVVGYGNPIIHIEDG